jgi:hypothetical protein
MLRGGRVTSGVCDRPRGSTVWTRDHDRYRERHESDAPERTTGQTTPPVIGHTLGFRATDRKSCGCGHSPRATAEGTHPRERFDVYRAIDGPDVRYRTSEAPDHAVRMATGEDALPKMPKRPPRRHHGPSRSAARPRPAPGPPRPSAPTKRYGLGDPAEFAAARADAGKRAARQPRLPTEHANAPDMRVLEATSPTTASLRGGESILAESPSTTPSRAARQSSDPHAPLRGWSLWLRAASPRSARPTESPARQP